MKRKISLALFIFLTSTSLLKAQWTQLDEPTGGNCWRITRVGGEIWAAYGYGVYISSNDGATWVHHPSLNKPTMDIKTIGDTIIILQESFSLPYIFKLETQTSYDGGITWNAPSIVDSGNSYYSYGARDIFITNSSLVINSNGEYFKSHDCGQSWDTLNLPPGTFGEITQDNNHELLMLSVYYPYKGTYLSSNGGDSWNFLDSNYTSQFTLIHDSIFYFLCGYTDTIHHTFIARTTDMGQTWDTLAFDLLPMSSYYLWWFNGKLCYAYYPNPQPPVKYESSDNGLTWSLSTMPADLFWINEERSILLYSWDLLLNVPSQGLVRYNPGTNGYYKTETGILAHDVDFLQENNGALFTRADDKLYISYDAGSTWTEPPAFVNPGIDMLFKGDTIVTSTKPTNYKSTMCYSYDNGHTWDSLSFINGTHWDSPQIIRQINGRLYIANYDYVAYSDDWGFNWDSIGSNFDTTCTGGLPTIYDPSCMETSNNNLIIYDEYREALAVLDTVTFTWKIKQCLWLPGVNYLHLFSLDNKIAFSGGGSYFLVSSDSGNTWTSPSNAGWPGSSVPSTVSSIDGVWYSPEATLYYSLNSGNSWTALPVNNQMSLPGYCGNVIASLNSILFIGGNNIWRNNDTLQLISGNVYFDSNNNGTKDANEKGIAGNLLYTTPFNIAFNADSVGNYSFLTAAVGDTLRPALATNFCSSNPAYYLTNGAASNVDFGIYFYPGVQDLAVDITNTNHFRPGFNSNIEVTVTNLGTVALPGELQVNLDSNLAYVSSSVVPTLISGNTLYFTTDTLHILETGKITIQTETNFMVPFGTVINCDASVQPVIGDTNILNNYSQLTDSVVASFDPNEKSCASGMYFTPTQVMNGDEMVYTVRFQNLGNIQADNIHIIDTLSYLFDFQSFRIISSSHKMHYSIAGNATATFYFDNIFLPPAITDEPGSHGFVKFAVKFKPGVSIGNAADNKAYIYFDFNPPIITNTVTTIVADPPANLSIIENKSNDKLLVYPNPASDILNGKLMIQGAKSFNLAVYNQLGMLVKSSLVNGNNFAINVNDLPDGLYYGRIIISELNRQVSFRFIRKN